ncbi:putative purine nucleoside phosphorylase, partial [Trichinella nelsoni]
LDLVCNLLIVEMSNFFSRLSSSAEDEHEQCRVAANYLKLKIKQNIQIAILCSKKFAEIGTFLSNSETISCEGIPGFPVNRKNCDQNNFVFGYVGKAYIGCMFAHLSTYDGYTVSETVAPVRILHLLGAELILFISTAFGLNQKFKAGDFMIIKDHLNFAELMGFSALAGRYENLYGIQFPNLRMAYDAEYRQILKSIAEKANLEKRVHEGVYTVLGNSVNPTRTEMEFIETLGSDAIGINLCHEIVAARQYNMRVVAIAVIGPADREKNEQEKIADAARKQVKATLFHFIEQFCIETKFA